MPQQTRAHLHIDVDVDEQYSPTEPAASDADAGTPEDVEMDEFVGAARPGGASRLGRRKAYEGIKEARGR